MKAHICEANDSSYDVSYDEDFHEWTLLVESEYSVSIKHCPYCGVKL
jgi:hypothetical protein